MGRLRFLCVWAWVFWVPVSACRRSPTAPPSRAACGCPRQHVAPGANDHPFVAVQPARARATPRRAARARARKGLALGGTESSAKTTAGGGGGAWTPLEDAALGYMVARVLKNTGHLPLAAPPSNLGKIGRERFDSVWGPLCAGVRALATPDLPAPRGPFAANQQARLEGGIIKLLQQPAPGDARSAAAQRAAAAAAAEPLRSALAGAGAAAAATAIADASAFLTKVKEETKGAAARAGETRKRKALGE